MAVQVVSTRWNSTLTMMKSVQQNLATLRSLGAESKDKTLQKLLLDVNDDLLQAVIQTLTPFDEATKAVSADKEPTLHLVGAVRHRLQVRLLQLIFFNRFLLVKISF